MATRHPYGPYILLLATILSGCATPERFILLPEASGKQSAVVIQPKGGIEFVLDKTYTTASVSGEQIKLEATDELAVRTRYKTVIEALPARPQSFTLNFEFGTAQLTKESATLLDKILQDLQHYTVPELTIIGHTDDIGSDAVNDSLSLERANSILNTIKAKDIKLGNVTAVGRGKRDPIVASRPGVPEPRNRRVEIRIK